MSIKELVIDSGLVTYDIKDKDGRSFGNFSFNPSDLGIVKRHEEVIEAFSKLEIPEMSGDNFAKEIEEFDKFISEKIDYLLGAEVSETFFGIMSPLSPLASGQFFVESVIDAIGQAIQNETGERVKKVAGRIKKHTSKYHG